MTRRADPQTTRLPVKPGELPAFTPVPRRCERHDGWVFFLGFTRHQARRPVGLAARWSLADQRSIEANGLASATARPERSARRPAKAADAATGA